MTERKPMIKKIINKILQLSCFQSNTASASESISPQQAHKIQKQDYIDLQKKFVKSCTPPFETIAQQLNDATNTVFEASVFYLCRIAVNEKKYQQEIISILKNYKKTHKDDHNRLNFIDNMLKSHKL